MPKLTLRDLFAVVTIAALALGWLADHIVKESLIDRLATALQRSDHKIEELTTTIFESAKAYDELRSRCDGSGAEQSTDHTENATPALHR